MEVGLKEGQYESLASLLYNVQNGKSGRSFEKEAAKLLDELNQGRNEEVKEGHLVLKVEQLHRVVGVLSKVEKGDFSPSTVKDAGNVLRHLEGQRIATEKLDWKLPNLNKEHTSWAKVSNDIRKIGMNEMDYRAAEKVLHEVANGTETAITKDVAKLTGKVFAKYQEEGNDPTHSYDVRVDPNLFERINGFMSRKGELTASARKEAGELLKELQIEKTFDVRDRESPSIVDKIIQYLSETLSRLKGIFKEDQEPQLKQEVSLIEKDEKFSSFVNRVMERVQKEGIPRDLTRYAGNIKNYVEEAPEHLVRATKAEFQDVLKELDLESPNVLSFTEGAIKGVIKDDSLGFEEKNTRIAGMLEVVYESNPRLAEELMREEAIELQIEESTTELEKENVLTLREVLEMAREETKGIPVKLPYESLDKPVKSYTFLDDDVAGKYSERLVYLLEGEMISKSIQFQDSIEVSREERDRLYGGVVSEDESAVREVKEIFEQTIERVLTIEH